MKGAFPTQVLPLLLRVMGSCKDHRSLFVLFIYFISPYLTLFCYVSFLTLALLNSALLYFGDSEASMEFSEGPFSEDGSMGEHWAQLCVA